MLKNFTDQKSGYSSAADAISFTERRIHVTGMKENNMDTYEHPQPVTIHRQSQVLLLDSSCETSHFC